MELSPLSVVLGLIVLAPLATFAGYALGGEVGGIAGLVIGVGISVAGSFKRSRA